MASDSDSADVVQKAEPNPSETHAEKDLPNPAAEANAPGNNYIKNEDSGEAADSSRRLWIGNLSPKLTELEDFNLLSNVQRGELLLLACKLTCAFFSDYGFHLLKLVQRFGSIDNFDFLFHRTGPSAGLPRGYAFITYQTAEYAKKCLEGLDGKKVLDRFISVRYAHQTPQAFMDEEEKLRKKLPALGMKAEAKPVVSKERAISAIEAKLRAMEREKDEVSDFCLTAVGSSTKNGSSAKSRSSVRNFPYASKSSSQFDGRNRSRPYSRYGSKKRF